MQRLAVLLFLLLSAVLPHIANAEHGQLAPEWINHMRDQLGTPCCGVIDCQVVHARILEREGDLMLVEIDGIIGWIYEKSLVPSADAHDYACIRLHAITGDSCHARDALGNHRIVISPACVICLLIAPLS